VIRGTTSGEAGAGTVLIVCGGPGFRTRPEAMAVIESWRQHYNDVRPHSSFGQRTPMEFKRSMQRR
jgi:hypothetical protein